MSIVSMYLKLGQRSTGTSAMLEVAGSSMKMAWLEAQKQLQKRPFKQRKKEQVKSIGQLESMRQIWPIG